MSCLDISLTIIIKHTHICLTSIPSRMKVMYFQKSGEMDWLSLKTLMVGIKRKTVTFWRSRSLKNDFPRQFHDNKYLWDSLVLYYFAYEVISFQIFFKYQNPENKLSYLKYPEFRINLEIFHPCSLKKQKVCEYI